MPEQRHVKLFRNGRNQAVRIPVEFELPGDEAIMHRDGERLVIEPVRKRGLVALLKTMQPLDEEFPRIDDPIAEMRERFSLGDYTGAFEMAELLLAEDPDDMEAAECAENCRGILDGMYAARLGPLDRVPTVVVQRAQLRWLSIDHRAGFVLSLIDGSSTLDMILDVSGMPRIDAMRILNELLQQKIVSLKP